MGSRPAWSATAARKDPRGIPLFLYGRGALRGRERQKLQKLKLKNPRRPVAGNAWDGGRGWNLAAPLIPKME